ncbi:MAG: GNAT family N-acetyltransferase [Candidatus Thorarchaeota archaeon]
MNTQENSERFIIRQRPSEEELRAVRKGLKDYNKMHPHGELDIPPPDISLVLKNKEGKIVGGVITSMLTGVMHLEVLWVDKQYRRRGYGRNLVLEAERIGKEKGYTASQTWTFSFQGPDFYRSIGYKLMGIYDGYTDKITEYIFMKKLDTNHQTLHENLTQMDGFSIHQDKSEESMKILHTGLHEHVTEHVGKLRDKNPEIQIQLVIKNKEDQVIGGLIAYTTLKTIHTEQVWIHETYRGQGYGKELLINAEHIAQEHGCISGLVNVLSFQNLDFFQNNGYEIFGISDGYPLPIKEYFLIKRFRTQNKP